MLTRIFIFALLGPIIPVIAHSLFVSLLALALPSFDILFGVGYIVYLYGTFPALVAGLADTYLVRWLTPLWRAIATGLFASFGIGTVLSVIGAPGLYGFVGFVPAAVCSVICSWLDERRLSTVRR